MRSPSLTRRLGLSDERLGEFWGHLAGWGFVAGKTASCAALTLGKRVIPVLGLVGCVVPAFSLPVSSVLAGCGVLTLGVLAYAVRRARR